MPGRAERASIADELARLQAIESAARAVYEALDRVGWPRSMNEAMATFREALMRGAT